MILAYLVRFAGFRDQDPTFPPAVALVTADSPQQNVSWPVDRRFTLFDVQCADV